MERDQPDERPAHTAFALKSPVLIGENCGDAPLRWASAVEFALREKIGGDVAYSGLLTKNPVHPAHRVLWGRNAYELDELAAYLPDLGKHRPLPHVRVENYGIGRNVDVFNHVRFHAYREIRHRWDDGLDAWIVYLGDLAHDFTCMEHSIPLTRTETRGIGRSVGKWTWTRLTPQDWARKQARRGKIGGGGGGGGRGGWGWGGAAVEGVTCRRTRRIACLRLPPSHPRPNGLWSSFGLL